MPRNGAGSYILPAGNPVVSNTTISSTVQNNTMSDIAGALTQSLSKDGQTTPTANLPMGGFKLTNLAAGSAPGNSLRYEQLFSQGIPTDIASASTVDIGAEYNTFLNVTGNTTITSFGTNYNGPRIVTFSASLTLTHNSTTLICPNGVNIITQAGDIAILIPKSTTSGTSDGWRIASYLRANNVLLNNDTQTIASASNIDFTLSQAQLFSITGTVDITSVTMYEAQPIFAIAAGAFKLVNGANLAVQGNADYTCTSGDVLMFIKNGAGVVYVFGINKVLNATNDPTFSSTSTTNAVSPDWVKGYFVASSFGYNQTPTDFTSSRSLSTPYTNSTGKPLPVRILYSSTSGTSVLSVSIAGGTAFPVACTAPTASASSVGFVVIPKGATYNFTVSPGSPSIAQWIEG